MNRLEEKFLSGLNRVTGKVILSFDQAKYIKDNIGDISGIASYLYSSQIKSWEGKDINKDLWRLWPNGEGHMVMGFEVFDEIPTLTEGDLIRALPDIQINRRDNGWEVKCNDFSTINANLIDSLFECFIWYKNETV